MHEIVISQLGEGLTEVRVVALLKQIGEIVAKDEPLLEVETDKAVMDIETPRAGRVAKWLVETGDVVPVGATVALIEPIAALPAAPPAAPIPNASVQRNGALSPREKARQKAAPPSSLAALETSQDEETASVQGQKWELSPRQSRLGQLLLDSERFVAEAWLSMPVPWDDLASVGRRLRGLQGLQYRPTSLELIAWCVMQAMRVHPKFRVLNGGEAGCELQNDASVGLSVALPNDELAVAGVVDASALDLAEFIAALRFNVGEASQGRIRPGRYPCVISYMAQHGVRLAAPRLILPSVSTLFVGAPFDAPVKAANGELQWQRVSNFVLTFDHRIINGAGAAAFLKEVTANLQKIEDGAKSPSP